MFIPIVIYFSYDDSGLCVKIGYLFFKRTVYPKTGAKKAKKVKKEQPKQEDTFLQKVKEKGISSSISEYASNVFELLKRIRWLLRKTFVKDFVLRIDVASSDPGTTAIEYGGVCAVVYPLISFAYTLTNFKNPRIEINADFDSEKPAVALRFKLLIIPVFFNIAGIGLIIKYITKIKDDNKVKSIKLKEV
ncbi:MAG TPA: DUF2953 domain-containing protein [Clostridiales bacterium]|nr:DUF2953 domain-containing protein [Clostridiales bacterium]